MEQHLLQPPAPVRYTKARSIAMPAFSRAISFKSLEQACYATGIDAEAKMNAEVTRLIWDHGDGRNVRCFDLRDKRLSIPDGRIRLRRDVVVRVNVDFLYVEAQKIRYFWAQFRKTFALSDVQLGVIASVFRRTFLVDEHEAADLDIFDMSVPAGASDRYPRLLRLSELTTIADDAVIEVLQRVVDAYDIVCSKDIDWRAARTRRPPKSFEGDLFPPP